MHRWSKWGLAAAGALVLWAAPALAGGNLPDNKLPGHSGGYGASPNGAQSSAESPPTSNQATWGAGIGTAGSPRTNPAAVGPGTTKVGSDPGKGTGSLASQGATGSGAH
jgi:hypothetical protein